MIEVRQTDQFRNWLDSLKDRAGKARILMRIDRLAQGNPGVVAPVGQGVSELKVNFGPGYRVYYVQKGETLIVLLCGGDKSSQIRDIVAAKQLAGELE